jgi:AraC-like DNA-binding protein
VNLHLEERISEVHVACFCDLSPSCFSRTFKRITGLSFTAFLLQARVERARQLLQDTYITVTQVCHQAGFRSLSHFSLMFRRYAGMSPTIELRNIVSTPTWSDTCSIHIRLDTRLTAFLFFKLVLVLAGLHGLVRATLLSSSQVMPLLLDDHQ